VLAVPPLVGRNQRQPSGGGIGLHRDRGAGNEPGFGLRDDFGRSGLGGERGGG